MLCAELHSDVRLLALDRIQNTGLINSRRFRDASISSSGSPGTPLSGAVSACQDVCSSQPLKVERKGLRNRGVIG